MRIVVTGAAGFLGSHLTDHLLAAGHTVVGVDAFTPFYARELKEANLADALGHPAFRLVEADLRVADAAEIVRDAELIIHLAGQAGVRESWSERFDAYATHNLVATQRILEAAVATGVRRVVYASSAAVYGATGPGPCGEGTPPRPISPFGVTTLAAEALLGAYGQYGLSTAALRYSTVYGPRQRPDMAVHRFIDSALTGVPVPLFGTGSQVRDFAYAADVVRATALIATGDLEGPVNVGSGECFSINEVIDAVTQVVGTAPRLERRPVLAGDPNRERIAIDRALEVVGHRPSTDLLAGLRAQAEAMEGSRLAEARR